MSSVSSYFKKWKENAWKLHNVAAKDAVENVAAYGQISSLVLCFGYLALMAFEIVFMLLDFMPQLASVVGLMGEFKDGFTRGILYFAMGIMTFGAAGGFGVVVGVFSFLLGLGWIAVEVLKMIGILGDSDNSDEKKPEKEQPKQEQQSESQNVEQI